MPVKRSSRSLSAAATKDSRQEVRWQALLDLGSASLGLLNDKGELVYASAPLARLCGRSARQVTGRALSGFIHAEDRGNSDAAFQRCLESADAITFTARLESASGEYR